jgi:hypothetical protein
MSLKSNSSEAIKTLCLCDVTFDPQFSGKLSADVPIARIDVRPSTDK